MSKIKGAMKSNKPKTWWTRFALPWSLALVLGACATYADYGYYYPYGYDYDYYYYPYDYSYPYYYYPYYSYPPGFYYP
jgi:hypothetical protein